MNKVIQAAIEQYQCPGCVCGSDISCFESYSQGVGCGKHCAGTTILPIGRVFLGLPKGFNRLGPAGAVTPDSPFHRDDIDPRVIIYEKFSDYSETGYDAWNRPVWKWLTEEGHTLVRVMSPRVNVSCVHVFLENCMDKIECLEVTKEMMEYMH